MRKSQTTAFLLLLFHIRKFIFFQKIYLKKLSLYCYICTQFILLHFFHVAGYWECGNTNAHIDIHWFCRRHTSIQYSWQQTRYFNIILIAMDYFTYLHISYKHLQFWKKSILIGTISFIIKSIRDRNISKTFFFHIPSKHLA